MEIEKFSYAPFDPTYTGDVISRTRKMLILPLKCPMSILSLRRLVLRLPSYDKADVRPIKRP